MIETDLVDLLYRQTVPGLIATVVNGGLLVLVLWSEIGQIQLLGWYSFIIVASGARYLLVRRYQKGRQRHATRTWQNRFLIGVIAAGIGWGAAGTLLFPEHSAQHQMFIFVIIAGMTAGAAPFLSPIQSVYMGYLIPALVPFAGWLFLQQNRVHTVLGALVLVYLAMLFSSSRHISRTIRGSLQLGYENAGLVRDLTNSKQELERIMESTTDAICVLGLDGKFLRANKAAASMFGYVRGNLISQHYAMLFSADMLARVDQQLPKVFKQGQVVSDYEVAITRKEGAIRTIRLGAAPLRDEQGIVAAVVSAEDITERKQVDRMKDEFVSTVSHELRTPLTSILGSLGLLRSGVAGKLDHEAQSLIGIGYENCERLLNRINDLLDIQKLVAGKMCFEVDAHELVPLINQAIEINRGFSERFQVRFSFGAKLPGIRVRVDKVRFQQVMSNLLSNAAKFSPPRETVEISMQQRNDRVRIAVADHGPGIPTEFQDRVFQRFTQADASDSRQEGGTGLGLSISRELVEHMHGHISFISEPNRGTTFFVDLPAANPADQDHITAARGPISHQDRHDSRGC